MSKATSVIKTIAIILAIPVVLYLMILTTSLAHGVDGPQLKQVFCNIEGKSGKFKTQIGGKSTEHEKPVLINGQPVYVQNQRDVTPEMEAYCASLPEVPKPCENGWHLVEHENGDLQKPICKGPPTGCPYGDSIPLDSPKCAPPVEVENTTPTPVTTEDTEVFYGK